MSKSKQLAETASIDTFKSFYSKVSYEELYSLDPPEFFNQIMIRDRYFTMACDLYSEGNKPTFLPLIERLLKGHVILDEDIFEKYTPKHIKIIKPNPHRGVSEVVK